MIDAHQHFWTLGRHGCVWPPAELAALHRDFAPEHLKTIAQPLGVRGSVLVQSQPDPRDTDFLLNLAVGDPFILGVVGWVDMASDDAPERIALLARRPKLKGLRPMLQDLEADEWIVSPQVAPALDAMEAHGLRLDALVKPRHLPALLELVEKRPKLDVIIDHGAKPPIRDGLLEPWLTHMRALATAPRVFAKLSGLVTEAPAGQERDVVRPYAGQLLDLFGAGRLMWGSDWPVVTSACSYGEWLAQAQRLVAHLGPAERDAVFGVTAARVYGL